MPDGTDLAPHRRRRRKANPVRGVPAPARTFDLVIAPRPFTPAVETMQAPEGSTIAEILAAAVNAGKLAFADIRYARVFVEGHELDLPADLDAKPAAGVTVNVAVTPQGGNHGLAKVLKSLLDVVITAIAVVVGGPIGAAIAIGGHLLVNALFKSSGGGGDTGNNYSIDSQSNQGRLHEMMPLVLGPRTIAPDLAGSAFTRNIGALTYIVVPVAWHFGPCDVDTIKVGNTPLASFPDGQVTVEHFLTPGPRNSTLYPMRVVQQAFSDLLDGVYGDWTVHSTDVDCERFELDFVAPQFYYASSSGKVEPADEKLTIQWSPYGENDWQDPPAGLYPAGRDIGGNAYGPGLYYLTACTKERMVWTTGWTFATKGRYDIRVKRNVGGGTTDQNVRDVTWAALRTIENVKPFPDETLAISVFQFQATSTVNGTVDVITGVVTPHAPKCVGGVWSDAVADWTADANGNAVRMARMMLVGPAALEPYTADDLDSSWATQHDLIEANGWYGAPDIRSDNVSQQDALALLEKVGRFNSFDNGSKLCLTPDWEKPAPRHMFTGRNASDYHYKRSEPDVIHGVLVKFPNLGEDCRDDELVVPDDDHTVETAEILEVLDFKSAITTTRAWKEGRRYLAQRQLLQETHEWTAHDDATLATLGDRVKVRHQSALYGKAEGRVKARRFSGALVAGVRLDNAVTMEAGKSYALTVRSDDQVLDELPLVNAETTTRELRFASPLAAASAPKAGDLFAFGEVQLITEDLVITDVAPNDDGVQFQALPYRWADIAAAETGDIPPLNTALTPLIAAPTPHIISKVGTPDGVVVVFSVPPQRQSPVAWFYARWRTNSTQAAATPGSWTELTPLAPTANTLKTPPIAYATAPAGDADAVIYVDVEIVTRLVNGQQSVPDNQAYGIPITRSVPAPSNFAAVGGVRTATDGSSHPVIAVSADPITSGLVSDMIVEISPAGANTWSAASCSPLPAANPLGDALGVLSGGSYDVRARLRTSDGWMSDGWTVAAGVDVDPNTNVASSAASVPWTGVTDDDGTRPSDGATKNTVTVGPTAPSDPTDGDLWADTSSTPVVWRAYNGVAWIDAATIGGTFASTLYESGSTLATLANFKTLLGTAAAVVGQAPAATDGTIASGATKNTLSYGPTAPASPSNGDLWGDTSSTPVVWKIYSGGAWQLASTVGGTFASNLYEAGSTLATLANFKTSLGTASGFTGQGSMATQNANGVAITGGSMAIGSGFTVDSSGNVTIRSATSGQRLVITNSLLSVYDSSNVLRVKLGLF